MKIFRLKNILIFTSVSLLIACGGRGGDGIPEGNSDFVDTEDPDNFIQFLNPQVSLPAGEGYQLKVGTETSNQTGSFNADIVLSDGTEINCSGNWSGTSGPNANDAGNFTCPSFDVATSGGTEISINSTVAACLYLTDRHDNAIVGKSLTGCADKTALSLPATRINFEAHGTAYYDVIDPDNTRTTLNNWKTANRFGEACTTETLAKFDDCEVQVQFRDTKDLGYGRNMFVRREDNGSGLTHLAIFVENFQVDAIPGLQYSALNYQSLIDDDRQWHFGTNAIEFSTYPYGTGEPSDGNAADVTNGNLDSLFTKFYTFRADRTDFTADEVRLDTVNLDDRGNLSMPGPCISCHGGKTRPLDLNGNLSLPYPGGLLGDVQAQWNMIEVDTLGFPERTDTKSAEQEAGLRFLNQAIYDAYLVVDAQGGEWNPATAMDLLAGAYGGVDTDGLFINQAYDNSYVPAGWQHDPIDNNPPQGSDTLYLQVVKPHCVTCHSKQGNDDNPNVRFDTYAAFIEHSEQIERYVFDKGLMPMSLLNFDEFWDTISPDKAALLGTFLVDFSHVDENGMVIEPGGPVAVPAVSGAVLLDSETEAATTTAGLNYSSFSMSAEGSSFSTNYLWEIVSADPSSTTASIENSNSVRAKFVNGVDGTDYVIRLTASNEEGESDSQLFKVTINESLTVDPSSLTFTNDILPIFSSTTPLTCDSGGCHSSGTNFIPMYLTTAQPAGTNLYEQVIQRVNFADPLESKLLRRPSGYQHPGGCLSGFDIFIGTDSQCSSSDNRDNYDLFLSWIIEGGVR